MLSDFEYIYLLFAWELLFSYQNELNREVSVLPKISIILASTAHSFWFSWLISRREWFNLNSLLESKVVVFDICIWQPWSSSCKWFCYAWLESPTDAKALSYFSITALDTISFKHLLTFFQTLFQLWPLQQQNNTFRPSAHLLQPTPATSAIPSTNFLSFSIQAPSLLLVGPR